MDSRNPHIEVSVTSNHRRGPGSPTIQKATQATTTKPNPQAMSTRETSVRATEMTHTTIMSTTTATTVPTITDPVMPALPWAHRG